MVARQVGPIWTVEQYLDLELHNPIRHEYHGGYVYAMSGGTQAHSQITVNVSVLLRAGVRGTGCRALNADIKIRQTASDYVYADAVVTCDARDQAPKQVWIDFPSVIVEVLSPSTERHDRGDKFEGYRAIPTFREYLLVDTRQRSVEVRRRDDEDMWTTTTYGPDDTIRLATLPFALSMDAIYEDSGL